MTNSEEWLLHHNNSHTTSSADHFRHNQRQYVHSMIHLVGQSIVISLTGSPALFKILARQ